MTHETSTPEKSEKVPFLHWCLYNPVEVGGSLLIILLTVVVFLQVFYRYALQSPLAWSEEFAMFLFQWCAFIGAAIATRHRFHYGLDLVTKRLPRRWKWATEILASVLIFFIAYLMITNGYGMMQITKAQKYPVMQFSVAYAYLAILLSGVLMMIYQVPIFVSQIRALKEG
jgi:TRAP-type transport system small permease protein